MLWVCLHAGGVHGALAGILARGLPADAAGAGGRAAARPGRNGAVGARERRERGAPSRARRSRASLQEPVWDWASRNLSAASERLLSPADRVERAVSPWSTLRHPAALRVLGDRRQPRISTWRRRTPAAILIGVILGLVIGKPLGIWLASLIAIKSRLALGPADVTVRSFIGAACLCGVGDTVALLLADQAFPDADLRGARQDRRARRLRPRRALGAAIIATNPSPAARTEAANA